MECVSDVPTPLSAARGKKLRLRQICVQVKVLRQTFLIAYISVTTVSFLSWTVHNIFIALHMRLIV